MTPIDFDGALALALDGILNERLAVLAGAGLSMAPPSNLPSAWTLAHKAKAEYDARYGTTRPSLSADIDEQTEFFFQRGELATVYLRTLIDQHAFSGRPNAGHSAIADLLLAKALRAAITTNVDPLIETAGTLLLGRVHMGVDGHAVATAAPGTAPLLKIHGCWMVDHANTVWAKGQLAVDPVKTAVERSAAWLASNLLDRDLLILGYSTDWNYLNEIFARTVGVVSPARVLVVDPISSSDYAAKAPELVAVGSKATAEFHHLQASGAEFLDALRKEFSRSFVRRAFVQGAATFADSVGSPPAPALLEPPDIDNDALWRMRRDLLGCRPDRPADCARPADEPLLGFTVLRLRAAGATADGSYWRIGGRSVRIIRAPNTVLHRIEAEFARETAPAVAPDLVVAVGAEDLALPSSIARAPVASIARGSGSRWITRSDAEKELLA